jgi:hypothetical protein
VVGLVFASLIAVAAAAAAHLRRLLACLHARPAKTRTNTETKNEKKEKNKRKNEKKSGAIGISPFSHSMMLPGDTNLGSIIRWHITLHKTHTDHQFINGLL